jgi:hypothetical protein
VLTLPILDALAMATPADRSSLRNALMTAFDEQADANLQDLTIRLARCGRMTHTINTARDWLERSNRELHAIRSSFVPSRLEVFDNAVGVLSSQLDEISATLDTLTFQATPAPQRVIE